MKHLLALFSLMTTCISPVALAAGSSSAHFSVAGTLIPGACQLTFDGGNVLRIDTQTIPEVNARNGLPIQHTLGFTLRCDDSMQTTLTVSDEHRSSSHVALDNSAYTLINIADSSAVGSFSLELLEAHADGVRVHLFNPNNRSLARFLLKDIPQFFSPGNSFSRGTPYAVEAQVVTGTLQVNTTFNSDLKSSQKIDYSGTANFTLNYL